MFTFCDLMHETKQKNVTKLSIVCSTDWKSSLSHENCVHVDEFVVQIINLCKTVATVVLCTCHLPYSLLVLLQLSIVISTTCTFMF